MDNNFWKSSATEDMRELLHEIDTPSDAESTKRKKLLEKSEVEISLNSVDQPINMYYDNLYWKATIGCDIDLTEL